MISKFFKLAEWSVIIILALVLILLLPVGYIETACWQRSDRSVYKPLTKDANFVRPEANSYLTYPEWHIVYAYEGLANVLKTGDEHEFDYLSSIRGFWRAFCDLDQMANAHGGSEFNTRGTIHTIGVSFTFEMAMKAVYEKTLGRLFASIRGEEKSPQDIYAAEMTADYAAFLQQVPWYEYDFQSAVVHLWSRPVSNTLRGWERRLALGGEWKVKAGYAQVIAAAVEASGHAPLKIRSVIKWLTKEQLVAIEGVSIIEETSDYIIIETPRYRKFTHILEKLVLMGGVVVEIAGNDEIMLSATGTITDKRGEFSGGEIISRMSRDGYDGERFLVNVKLRNLGTILMEIEHFGLDLEHIYDY
jgi:hypothetical protein